MAHPDGPLLRALAPRILANLNRIDELASAGADGAPGLFPETQLLVSLLGVLVFPQQRSDEALGQILRDYAPLPTAVTIHHPKAPGGLPEDLDPERVEMLPRMLRNGLAHFNLLPIPDGDRFAGIRVWNEDRGHITFVADLDFREVRRLAGHVLAKLADEDQRFENPVDPLERLGAGNPPPTGGRPQVRISDTIWARLVAACGGDADRAHREKDRALTRAAETLAARPDR